MTEKEAYGNITEAMRISARYAPGDKVTVGPAYLGSGQYGSDGNLGDYVVLKSIGKGDYKLCKGDALGDWDLICHVSRLIPR
jgi:hypothetical protein